MADGNGGTTSSTSRWSRDDCTKAADRLGPYASREEAEHALEKVAARNEE